MDGDDGEDDLAALKERFCYEVRLSGIEAIAAATGPDAESRAALGRREGHDVASVSRSLEEADATNVEGMARRVTGAWRAAGSNRTIVRIEAVVPPDIAAADVLADLHVLQFLRYTMFEGAGVEVGEHGEDGGTDLPPLAFAERFLCRHWQRRVAIVHPIAIASFPSRPTPNPLGPGGSMLALTVSNRMDATHGLPRNASSALAPQGAAQSDVDGRGSPQAATTAVEAATPACDIVVHQVRLLSDPPGRAHIAAIYPPPKNRVLAPGTEHGFALTLALDPAAPEEDGGTKGAREGREGREGRGAAEPLESADVLVAATTSASEGMLLFRHRLGPVGL